MIKLFIAVIIAGTSIFLGCSKNTDFEDDTIYECKQLFSTDDSLRSTSKTLKGFILFSWKTNNSWSYSIVENLNIRPAHENVCSGNSITGEDCLKKNLHFFAESEKIYWTGNHEIITVEGKKINLSYPPNYIVTSIQTFCDSMKIELIIEF